MTDSCMSVIHFYNYFLIDIGLIPSGSKQLSCKKTIIGCQGFLVHLHKDSCYLPPLYMLNCIYYGGYIQGIRVSGII